MIAAQGDAAKQTCQHRPLTESCRANKRAEVADLWESALDTVFVVNGTLTSYSTSPHELWKLGQTEVGEGGEEFVAGYVRSYAAGKYKVTTGLDGWSGYAAERRKFLDAMKPAGGNTVVYTGAWCC